MSKGAVKVGKEFDDVADLACFYLLCHTYLPRVGSPKLQENIFSHLTLVVSLHAVSLGFIYPGLEYPSLRFTPPPQHNEGE